MSDYVSNDTATAAYLAQGDERETDEPTRAEAEEDERDCRPRRRRPTACEVLGLTDDDFRRIA